MKTPESGQKTAKSVRKEPWDLPVVGLEAWLNGTILDRWPRCEDDQGAALREFEALFDRVPTTIQKRKLAYKIAREIGRIGQLWRNMNPAALPPLALWIRDKRWSAPPKRFVELVSEANQYRDSTPCTPRQWASFFRAFVDDREIGQDCRELVAMLEHDGETWRNAEGFSIGEKGDAGVAQE